MQWHGHPTIRSWLCARLTVSYICTMNTANEKTSLQQNQQTQRLLFSVIAQYLLVAVSVNSANVTSISI